MNNHTRVCAKLEIATTCTWRQLVGDQYWVSSRTVTGSVHTGTPDTSTPPLLPRLQLSIINWFQPGLY
jgi:hypothetical protein